MGKRVIFVTEATRSLDPSTRSGRRLGSLLGVASVPAAFTVVPLTERWEGVTSRGARFPFVARQNAAALWTSLPPGRLVLVGPRVAAAFQIDTACLRWRSVRRLDGARVIERTVAVIPTPLGRWWSDPTHEVLGRRFLRAFVGLHGGDPKDSKGDQ